MSWTNLSVTANSSQTAAACTVLEKKGQRQLRNYRKIKHISERKIKKGPWVLPLGINALFWETGHLVQRKTHPASRWKELTTCTVMPWHHVCHGVTSSPPGTGFISAVQTSNWVHPTKTPISCCTSACLSLQIVLSLCLILLSKYTGLAHCSSNVSGKPHAEMWTKGKQCSWESVILHIACCMKRMSS